MTWTGRRRALCGILVVIVSGLVARAQGRPFTPVTDAMLQNPAPENWLAWRRTPDGWGYSPLNQITKENAHQLQLVWSWAHGAGVNQAAPLVYNGVMYIPEAPGVVQALNAVTGDLIWEYRKKFEASPSYTWTPRTRSIAIYGDNIYVSTPDAHIVALDAQTGKVAWDHTVADYKLGYRYTSGPIVAQGKIVAGMTGCERYKDDVCFISAHDARTGNEVWRTSTIARPGEPGGDSWDDLPLKLRAGGDAWIPGSYDPKLNLVYWSTAQAKPWARVSRGTDGDALYTNSTLAIDAATGRLAWYYQFIPGETHDLDEVFESVLIDHDGRASLFKMGKIGVLWELDRTTGKFVAAHDLGYQNVVDVDSETGKVTYRPDMIPKLGVELEFCPDIFGVKNWQAMAYHPETHALYIPIHPSCEKAVFTEAKIENVGDFHFYGDSALTGYKTTSRGAHPKSLEYRGHLVAMDIENGRLLWSHKMRATITSAALTTAGGLAIVGDRDRYLYVNDIKTGTVLFQLRLPAPVVGFPITYAVDGRQYLAVPTQGSGDNAMYVFALPQRRAT